MSTTSPSRSTAATASDLGTTLLTALFAGGPARQGERVSPATAFQAALYGRALILDARPETERLVHGDVDPQLFDVLLVDADAPAVAYLNALDRDPAVPVYVIGSDNAPAEGADAVGPLRRLGVQAFPVDGGFRGWRSAGMPVRRLP